MPSVELSLANCQLLQKLTHLPKQQLSPSGTNDSKHEQRLYEQRLYEQRLYEQKPCGKGASAPQKLTKILANLPQSHDFLRSLCLTANGQCATTS